MAGRDIPVRVGLVGCGEVADQKHLRVLGELAEARVVALADTDPTRLNRVADRHGIKHRYASAEALLQHPGLEAVGVAVPPSAHAAVAVPALEAGKHVYLEKPLALSLDDADRILEAARAIRVVCLMGFHMRWHRLILRARELVKAGRLGRIESIRTLWFSPRDDLGLPGWRHHRESGGGALMELGGHCFDLWRYLTEAEVEQVHALVRPGTRADEVATVSARLSGGILASAVISERTSHEIEVEVCGDAGRVRVGCQRLDGLEFFPAGSAPGQLSVRLRSAMQFLRELPGGVAGMRKGADYMGSYREAWRHFCRLVREGGEPGCTIEDGHRALEVALAAVRHAVTAACPGDPTPGR